MPKNIYSWEIIVRLAFKKAKDSKLVFKLISRKQTDNAITKYDKRQKDKIKKTT